VNTHIKILKVWLKSMTEIQHFFIGDCFLLAHPVYMVDVLLK